MLTQGENLRYNRHLILPEIGIKGQEKLKQTSVLIIGAGGLGCPVLQYLTAAGIGTIGIADFDVVEESNLQRQVLFSVADIGKPKAVVAAEKLKAQNSFVKFKVFQERISSENAVQIISPFDIIVDGTDNFQSRYLINDACVIAGKPLVFGSILRFEGQLSVFNYKGGPTYRCIYPEPPEELQSCSGAGVIGVLPGIIGSLQANEVIKIAVGIGKVLSGELLLFDALVMQFSTFQFEVNEENLKISSLQKEEGLSCEPYEISADDLLNKINAGENIKVYDLREEYERTDLKIPVIPFNFSDIADAENLIDKNSIAVFVCQKGLRSKAAVKHLLQSTNILGLFSLSGGAESMSDR
jgi:sulfur-carrier protein adenylyltransferase/sulfurtransferase